MSTFNISKEVYFNSISQGFKDNINLLNAVKQDYNRIDIEINGIQFTEYYEFLEYVIKNYPDYLKKILLISNQNAHFYYYNKIFNILSKKDYHLVSTVKSNKKDDKFLKTRFTLNILVKQAILYNKYNIITVNDDKKEIHKILHVTTIIDLVILDPILIKLHYEPQLSNS